jgi:hypothetical protein
MTERGGRERVRPAEVDIEIVSNELSHAPEIHSENSDGVTQRLELEGVDEGNGRRKGERDHPLTHLSVNEIILEIGTALAKALLDDLGGGERSVVSDKVLRMRRSDLEILLQSFTNPTRDVEATSQEELEIGAAHHSQHCHEYHLDVILSLEPHLQIAQIL